MLKIYWGDSLPMNENVGWNEQFLTRCKHYSVTRCIFLEHSIRVELNGFSNASELAYRAVVYLKYINSYENSTV